MFNIALYTLRYRNRINKRDSYYRYYFIWVDVNKFGHRTVDLYVTVTSVSKRSVN